MEQNENQYEESERRKAAFLIGGFLVILAAVILVIYLFASRTRASTGEGEAVRITPERIEQISDKVSEQVLDTLGTEIVAGRVRDAVEKELSSDKLYEILSDGKIEAVAVGEEELRDVIAVLLADLGISGGEGLSEEQKKFIRLAVKEALEKALSQISVAQLLTDEEKRELEERLKQELAGMIGSQVQNSTCRLTDAELEKLKQSLKIESLVTGAVDKVTKQQMEQIKAKIITEIKKSVKTPVKGKDYFTDADIRSVQEKVLKATNRETIKQVESLVSKINEVKTSVNTLSKLVKELHALDQQKSADIRELQNSITRINQSIQNINKVTNQLADAVTITGSRLEKVTGSGSNVQSEPVSTANMTIAQFVDVLAGNGQAYTRAIQELNKIVNHLKDEAARQDENFTNTVKELEQSLSDNGKNLEDSKAELEKSDQELKAELEKNGRDLQTEIQESGEKLQKQLDGKSEDLEKKLADERKEREAADEKLQKQADAADKLTGDPKDAGEVKGDTVFQKIGAIVGILSKDGISGLFKALKGIGGAETVQEGLETIHTSLTDARERVAKLEKEKWLSDLTLLADQEGGIDHQGQGNGSCYAFQESGSAYVYQIPLVTENDHIDLSADDTAVVVHFTKPDRLPSNVALSTTEHALQIAFTNKPTRDIHITSIHVYNEN